MSRLRTLKTYMRSTMNQERLSSLALAYIHRDIELDPEKPFAADHSCKLQFVNILGD